MGKIFSRYWQVYGGWAEIVSSVYFHAAIVICALSYSNWLEPDWWNLVISIVPNMLGFTLGGYALLVSFLGERFRKLISGATELPDGTVRESPFLEASASFAHFVLVQAAALLAAVLAHGCHAKFSHSLIWELASASHIPANVLGSVTKALWAVGYLLFSYSVCLAPAAIITVFRVGTWLDKYDALDEDPPEAPAQSTPKSGEDSREDAQHQTSATAEAGPGCGVGLLVVAIVGSLVYLGVRAS